MPGASPSCLFKKKNVRPFKIQMFLEVIQERNRMYGGSREGERPFIDKKEGAGGGIRDCKAKEMCQGLNSEAKIQNLQTPMW